MNKQPYVQLCETKRLARPIMPRFVKVRHGDQQVMVRFVVVAPFTFDKPLYARRLGIAYKYSLQLLEGVGSVQS